MGPSRARISVLGWALAKNTFLIVRNFLSLPKCFCYMYIYNNNNSFATSISVHLVAIPTKLGTEGLSWESWKNVGTVLGTTCSGLVKGSMPPSIGHMELLVWMQRADFSEHIQGCKSPGDPLNS